MLCVLQGIPESHLQGEDCRCCANIYNLEAFFLQVLRQTKGVFAPPLIRQGFSLAFSRFCECLEAKEVYLVAVTVISFFCVCVYTCLQRWFPIKAPPSKYVAV